jgi:hypothetical protein
VCIAVNSPVQTCTKVKLALGMSRFVWHTAAMNIEDLAETVRAKRLANRWSVQEAANRARVSRITWKRVEDGLPVQDVKRRAVEDLLCIGEPLGQLSAAEAAAAGELGRHDLNPDLAEFTDQELLDEVAGRLLLLAARLQAAGGVDVLAFSSEQDGSRRIVSHTTRLSR